MKWGVSYTHRTWRGLFCTFDRDSAIAKAKELTKEGKTRVTVHGPAERFEMTEIGDMSRGV